MSLTPQFNPVHFHYNVVDQDISVRLHIIRSAVDRHYPINDYAEVDHLQLLWLLDRSLLQPGSLRSAERTLFI